MHRAAAAKGDQHELARVVTAPHRDQLQGVDHVGVSQADDAHGRLFDAHIKCVGDGPHGRLGLFDIQRDLSAQEVIGVDAPRQDVGVADGWLVTAPAVAYRSGVSPGADRTYPQRARFVEPGNRAAASANLDDVDGGHQDGIPGIITPMLDLVLGGDLGRAFLYQRGFGRRAADVQRDDVRLTDHLADEGGANDPGHWPRLDQVNRGCLTRLKGCAAAVGLHHVQRVAIHPHSRQVVLQMVQVGLGDGVYIAVEHHGAGPFELAPLLGDLV